MKTGKIFIIGAIGTFYDETGELIKGVELVDVVAQVATQLDAKSFDVYISSEGGLIDEGFKIYDYLKGLEVPVNTIGRGLVASIATVIFMAGKTRRLEPNTNFMIHLPSGGVQGDSQDIKEYADMMIKEEKRILKFYSENTKLKESTLLPLLQDETWLDAKKAYKLGFSTEKPSSEPVQKKAIAHFNSKHNKKMAKKKDKNKSITKKEKSIILKGLKALGNLLGGDEPKMLTIQDSNGVEVVFPEVENMEDVAVGDKATVEGADADGEYTFPDGKTYIFKAGVLDSIEEGEEEEEEETVEDLKAKVKTLEAEKEALAKKNKKGAKEFKAFKSKLETQFGFANVKTEGKKKGKKKKKSKTTSHASNMAKRAEKLQEKRRKRSQQRNQ